MFTNCDARLRSASSSAAPRSPGELGGGGGGAPVGAGLGGGAKTGPGTEPKAGVSLLLAAGDRWADKLSSGIAHKTDTAMTRERAKQGFRSLIIQSIFFKFKGDQLKIRSQNTWITSVCGDLEIG